MPSHSTDFQAAAITVSDRGVSFGSQILLVLGRIKYCRMCMQVLGLGSVLGLRRGLRCFLVKFCCCCRRLVLMKPEME